MELYIQLYDTDWSGIKNSETLYVEKNKIFLIGSSNLYSINATKINEKLSQNNENFIVYNLADMADDPIRRLKSIENLISNEPKIILYGIGVWEFQKFKPSNHDYSLTDFLLEPKQFFTYFFESSTNTSVKEIVANSPKDRMLTFAKYILRGPDQTFHPFIKFKETPINNIDEIKRLYGNPKSNGLDLNTSNSQIIALKQIIKKLEQKNIKVILFSIPQHAQVLNSLEPDEITDFENLLLEQSTTNVYFLHDKYSEMNIWREFFHIAVHSDANIYTDDIYEIISKEIKQ
tara:strand:- start:4622 stop:5488 length:867 start_codon:yes stop_codon:yes gene_type:complete